jgi:formamidopyrimidine-DNA glycosylase
MSAEQVPVTTDYLKTSLMLIDNQHDAYDVNTSKFTPENIKKALTELDLINGEGNYYSDEATLYQPKLLHSGEKDIDRIYKKIVSYEVPPVSTGGKRKSRKNRRSRKMKVRKSKSQRRRR